MAKDKQMIGELRAKKLLSILRPLYRQCPFMELDDRLIIGRLISKSIDAEEKWEEKQGFNG